MATNTMTQVLGSLLKVTNHIKLLGRRHNSYWKLAHYYSLLRTKPSSSQDEIKANFLKLSKVYHPDNLETGDQVRFVRIKDAYDKIKDAPLKKACPEEEEDDLSHAAFVRRSKRTASQWTKAAGHQTKSYRKFYH